MELENLGYNETLATFRKENNLEAFEVGRISAEHKERYTVKTLEGEYHAEITGNMRYAAESREDFPAVGDWVALNVFDDLAIIHKIFPRYSVIKRQASGHQGTIQIIATNIDFAFIVQAADRDFNLNRLERYFTICYDARVQPIVVFSKIDLLEEQLKTDLIDLIRSRVKEVPVLAVSNQNMDGLSEVKAMIESGKTYCLLGSSGVGKSTLLNNLAGEELMKTKMIGEGTQRGKHTTSHRELIVLPEGGIIIDNPGMREVGIADAAEGLQITFDEISNLAAACKFKDCTHTSEAGCAVIAAVEAGDIDEDVYENYLKMEREKEHFELTVAERRKKDKAFGKMIKNVKKDLGKIKPSRD
jgi:ribosome biogenesis GTPase